MESNKEIIFVFVVVYVFVLFDDGMIVGDFMEKMILVVLDWKLFRGMFFVEFD